MSIGFRKEFLLVETLCFEHVKIAKENLIYEILIWEFKFTASIEGSCFPVRLFEMGFALEIQIKEILELLELETWTF